MIGFVRATWPGKPIALVGHSSGAGLLLNHVAFAGRRTDVAGYGFLSPFFGFRSKTEVADPKSRFSHAAVWPFALNSMSFGLLFRHTVAVWFNYPAEIIAEDSLLVPTLTVAMANATTPLRPSRDIGRVTPAKAWIGSDDEVVDPTKLRDFLAEYAPEIELEIIDGVTHLGILQDGADPLGEWLLSLFDPL
jgi:alpha-beta hydrolase superfamily lysophospholipase